MDGLLVSIFILLLSIKQQDNHCIYIKMSSFFSNISRKASTRFSTGSGIDGNQTTPNIDQQNQFLSKNNQSSSPRNDNKNRPTSIISNRSNKHDNKNNDNRIVSSNSIQTQTTSTNSIKSNLTEQTNITSIPSLSQTPLIKESSISSINPNINNSLNSKPILSKIKDANLLREIENLRISYRQQNFWKYHIIKIAPNEFYMTTNPDKRHRFIRNAPSYFVKLELPNDNENEKDKNKNKNIFKNLNQVDKGFRLIFTQQQVIGINGYDGNYQSFIIEKIPKSFGGNYKISCQYNEFQKDWNIQNNLNKENFKNSRNLNFQFINSNGKISKKNLTDDEKRKEKENDKEEKEKKLYDSNNNLILIDDYKMGDFLHVCCIKDKKKSLFIKNKIDGVKLAKTNSVYFLDTGFFKQRKWFDPIVAVFRPCNRDVKNKLTKSMLNHSKFNISDVSSNSKKLFIANKLNVDFSNINLHSKNDDNNNNEHDNDNEDEDDEFDYDNEDDEDEEMSENVIDLDNSTSSNYSKFYNAKDGLYNRHPKDDSPNDYKLGWLTIYEKGRYFEKIPNGGNWQMVVGMTFATGFEKIIDKYLKDLSDMENHV